VDSKISAISLVRTGLSAIIFMMQHCGEKAKCKFIKNKRYLIKITLDSFRYEYPY